MKPVKQKQRPNIVSVHLSPEGKKDLDWVCENRGMTIKTLLGRLITWFVDLDKTEQSIVLGQVEASDVKNLAELVSRRRREASGNGVDRPRRSAARES